MGIPGINQISFGGGEPVSAKKLSEEAGVALNKSDKQTPGEFKNVEKENPISKRGEFWKLLPATFVCGACGFLKLVATMVENDSGFLGDLFDLIGEKAKDKIKDKKITVKLPKECKSPAGQIGLFAAAFVGITVLTGIVYTAFKLPEINYKSKKNAFTKGRDMDVYIAQNRVETKLYDQLNKKIKNATPKEKSKLSSQYLKLNASKQDAPEFENLDKTVKKAVKKQFNNPLGVAPAVIVPTSENTEKQNQLTTILKK